MRFLQYLTIALMLAASAPALAQEMIEETDLARALEIGQGLAAASELTDRRQWVDKWLEALSREFGPVHPVLLAALDRSGQAFYQLGDYSSARRLFERRAELSERLLGNEHRSTLTAKAWLAEALRELAEYSEAREVQEELVELSTRILGAEHPDTLNAVGNLAATLKARGELDAARQHLERIFEIRARIFGAEHPDTFNAIHNLAAILSDQGDLAGARRLQVQAVEGLGRILGEEHLLTLIAVGNLASTLKAQGDLAGARQLEEQVAEGRANALGSKHPHTLIAVNNLAETLYAQGELGDAQQRFEQVVEGRTHVLGAEHPDTLTAVSNLAQILAERGDTSSAQNRLEEVVESRTRILGAEHPDTLLAVNNLTQTLADQDAQKRLEQVVEGLTRNLGAEHPDTLIVMHNLAVTLFDLGEIDGAHRLLEQVAESRSHLRERHSRSSLLMDGETLVALAKIHRQKGNVEEAARHYLSALDVLENHVRHLDFSEDSKNEFRARYQSDYHGISAFFLEQGWLDEAFHILERYRGQDLLTLLRWNRARKANERSFAADSELEALYRRHDALTIEIDRLGENAPAALQAERSRLLREIQIRRGREILQLPEAQSSNALRVDEIRQHLEPGTAMLAYSVAPEGIHLFVLARERPLVVVPLPITVEELRSQNLRFLELVLTDDRTKTRALVFEDTVEVADADARLALGRWFFERLIAPAAEHFQDAERLVIVPDDALHYLPFAALVRPTETAASWQYLVEWKPFHMTQSATAYAGLLDRRRATGDSAAAPTLVALGDPSYPAAEEEPPEAPPADGPEQPEAATDDAGGLPRAIRLARESGLFETWDPLPHTRREVESIADLFQGSARVFLGADATEENAKAELSAARFIHFATHGLMNSQQPRYSFLALTVPEGFPPERENGILQAWEIVDQLRLDADLVVLSACVTALGPVQAGEGLMSLSRAFQVAGARTVAASLWPVADDSTAELMIRFYRHLLASEPKDEALRAAQMELIAGPIEFVNADGETVTRDFSAPYHWAAFQLIGDWQ